MKIPLERTIGDTYKFAFSNILSIFGIAWFPFVLMIALIAAGVWWLLPEFAALDWSAAPDVVHNHDVALRIGLKMLAVAPLAYFLFYLLLAMVTVGMQRKALGLIEGPVFVYFSLSGAVWRLLGGMIAAVILFAIAGFLTFAAVSVVYWLGEHYALPAIYGIVEFAATVAAICWCFYMGVRLFFFISPAVVAEGGFGLARSWQLGSGNFWRIVGIFLACVFGPMIVISLVSQIVFMPFMGAAMMQMQHAAENNQIVTPQEMWATLGPALHKLLPYWLAYEALVFPVMLGLQNGVSAFAYRNLTRSEIPA